MRTHLASLLALLMWALAQPCAAQQNTPNASGAPAFDSQHAESGAQAASPATPALATPAAVSPAAASPATPAAVSPATPAAVSPATLATRSPATPAPELQLPTEKRRSTRFTVAPDSSRVDLTLYVLEGINPVLGPGGRMDSGQFVPLCRAPCEFSLRSGTHLFGVAAGDKSAIKLDRELHAKRGENVVVQYHSRLWHRVGGWVLLLGGVSAGSVLLIAGSAGDQPARIGLEIGGSVLTALSLVGGLWLANLPDRATGWVEP